MRTLLAALMDSGRFDVITVDLSTCLSDAAITVMDTAERICFVTKTQEPGVREESYRNQLISSCGEDITHRIIRETNMIAKEQGPVDILDPLEGDFGNAVRKLAERLMNVVQ